jgi:hypothetical protein
MRVNSFSIAVFLLVLVVILCIILVSKSKERIDIVGYIATDTKRVIDIGLILLISILFALKLRLRFL